VVEQARAHYGGFRVAEAAMAAGRDEDGVGLSGTEARGGVDPFPQRGAGVAVGTDGGAEDDDDGWGHGALIILDAVARGTHGSAAG
jgi:hypothetical protein